MKKITLLLLLLFTTLCYSQRTYDVTQGELYFIHPREGIILKKDDLYFKVEIGLTTYKKLEYNVTLESLDYSRLKLLLEDRNNVYPKDIISNYDFSKLHKLAFIRKSDYEQRVIRQVGPDYFAEIEEEEGEKDDVKEVWEYFFIRFGDKKIAVLGSSKNAFIISTLTGLELAKGRYKDDRIVIERAKKKLSTDIVYQINSYVENYATDTINGKIGVNNRFGEMRIPPLYDSIAFHNLFIACYAKGKPELYNHIFEKLKLPGLRVFIQPDSWAPFGIVLQDKPRSIDVRGNDNKVWGYSTMSMEQWQPFYNTEVVKEGQDFFIELPGADVALDNELWDGSKRRLYHTRDIDSIFIPGNIVMIESTYGDFDSSQVVCCKMTDGTYKLEYLKYFLQKESLDTNYYPNVLPKGLSLVKEVQGVEIYRNGLVGYFPFNKEPRYKKIGRFVYKFAPFVLPDGRKGWLCEDGKEYLDD